MTVSYFGPPHIGITRWSTIASYPQTPARVDHPGHLSRTRTPHFGEQCASLTCFLFDATTIVALWVISLLLRFRFPWVSRLPNTSIRSGFPGFPDYPTRLFARG
jgi:steroid 5-alpha reductase family enzyme